VPKALREIRDPKALRAVAHPFRLRLLDLLVRRGTLTSAEAAAATGESTGSCSFHLRQLAKYGYVEEAEAQDGRERRWRRVAGGERVPDSSDPELSRATAEVARVLLDRAISEAEVWLAHNSELPQAWQKGAVLDDELLYLTAAELRALSRRVLALLGAYRDRTAMPSKRPRGARPVRAVALLFPTDDEQ
jgi:DNA-binding transcriptional ArsR family regulator